MTLKGPYLQKVSLVEGNLNIRYYESGQGPVALLLHGGGPGAAGMSNFRKNVSAFSEHFRVIVPDLPGYGGSDKPDVSRGIYGLIADSLCALMDALSIPKAHLVGNSLGGGAALRLAIDHPERVEKLVLMGPGGSLATNSPTPSEGLKLLFSYYENPGPSRERLLRFLEAMVFDKTLLTEDLIEERYLASIEPSVIANPLLTPARRQYVEPLWPEFHKIRQQTLLLWGLDDRTILLDHAWLLLKQIPDIRLYVINKTGHWVQWERPEEFNQVVLNFLNT